MRCSRPRHSAAEEIVACNALSKDVAAQDETFLARAKTIRTQHILMLDYDRQMIAALEQQRAALEATTLTELSVNEEVAGCSGDKLDDMRRRAHEEMLNLRSYLNDFNRALHYDPPGVFIDK